MERAARFPRADAHAGRPDARVVARRPELVRPSAGPRDVFAALDADEDGSVTTAEIATEDVAQLAAIVELVQAVLPLPNLLVDTAHAAQRDGTLQTLWQGPPSLLDPTPVRATRVAEPYQASTSSDDSKPLMMSI